ncbi:MAG: DNA methyltransferase [Burkholderiales bacterium]
MTPLVTPIFTEDLSRLRAAAKDQSRVSGLTHSYYRYPARFSPNFVSEVIECFSSPGDLVLDPYMGGGTTIVEAYVRGRRSVGCDLNSLAVFVGKAKTTMLAKREIEEVRTWASQRAARISYRDMCAEAAEIICADRTRNLDLPRARPVKKYLAIAMVSLNQMRTENAKVFARSVLLNVGQWALNGKLEAPTLEDVRRRVLLTCDDMLAAQAEMQTLIKAGGHKTYRPKFIHASAARLGEYRPFSSETHADLVITSPPYPGIHILYHRWQVDGRKETAAPYWIANCLDGKGTGYYNFADRGHEKEEEYFSTSLLTLRSIRNCMKDGAVIVQMVAFSNPVRQLPKYLFNMQCAGFEEVTESIGAKGVSKFRRTWRNVPGRAWHAASKGNTNSSSEVVLIHQAI